MKIVKLVFALLTAVYLLIGIIFVAVGIFVMKSTNDFRAEAYKTTAQILSLQDQKPYVSYTDKNGETVERYLNEYSSSMYTGQELTVYVNDSGSKIATDSNVLFIVFIAVGGGFTALGIVFVVIDFFVFRKINKILNGNEEQNTLPECFNEQN